MSKQKKLFLSCVGAVVSIVIADQVSATCLHARGKITNNVQASGTTLGVVALDLSGKKSKCALLGIPLAKPSDPSPHFTHTIVCDSKVSSEEPQPQVTFITSFEDISDINSCPGGDPVFGPFSFSFIESSIPDPTTARGDFEGINNLGQLDIKGIVNCAGGVQMKFEGELCFDDPN